MNAANGIIVANLGGKRIRRPHDAEIRNAGVPPRAMLHCRIKGGKAGTQNLTFRHGRKPFTTLKRFPMAVQLTQDNATFAETPKGFFTRIGEWFTLVMEAQSRANQVQALYSKSDAELAKLGITRDQIPYYVFRDKAWI